MLAWLILSSFLSYAEVDPSDRLLTSMGTTALLEKLKTQGLCGSATSARLCRMLPWLPNKDEGAIDMNGNVYVFVKASSLKDSYPLKEWVDKFPEEKMYEYVSYVLAMRRAVADTMSSNSLGGLYILILDGEGDNFKPKSVFLATSQNITTQAYAQEEAMRADLAKNIPEWIPPEDYDKTFQFKLIE